MNHKKQPPVGQTFLSDTNKESGPNASANRTSIPDKSKKTGTNRPVGQTFLSDANGFGETSAIKITKRHLPHWTATDVIYFVTFGTIRDKSGNPLLISDEEQLIVLDHLKQGDGKYYTLFAATVMPDHVHLLLKPHKGIELSRIMKGIKGVSARKINADREARMTDKNIYPTSTSDESATDKNVCRTGSSDAHEADRNVYPTRDSGRSVTDKNVCRTGNSQAYVIDKNINPAGVGGSIWYAESYDRIIRHQDEFIEKFRYMLHNPLKKGLTDDPWNYQGWYFNEEQFGQ